MEEQNSIKSANYAGGATLILMCRENLEFWNSVMDNIFFTYSNEVWKIFNMNLKFRGKVQVGPCQTPCC